MIIWWATFQTSSGSVCGRQFQLSPAPIRLHDVRLTVGDVSCVELSKPVDRFALERHVNQRFRRSLTEFGDTFFGLQVVGSIKEVCLNRRQRPATASPPLPQADNRRTRPMPANTARITLPPTVAISRTTRGRRHSPHQTRILVSALAHRRLLDDLPIDVLLRSRIPS